MWNSRSLQRCHHSYCGPPNNNATITFIVVAGDQIFKFSVRLPEKTMKSYQAGYPPRFICLSKNIIAPGSTGSKLVEIGFVCAYDLFETFWLFVYPYLFCFMLISCFYRYFVVAIIGPCGWMKENLKRMKTTKYMDIVRRRSFSLSVFLKILMLILEFNHFI